MLCLILVSKPVWQSASDGGSTEILELLRAQPPGLREPSCSENQPRKVSPTSSAKPNILPKGTAVLKVLEFIKRDLCISCCSFAARLPDLPLAVPLSVNL